MTPKYVYEQAQQHRERYLLPKGNAAQDEDQRRACRALVESGHAVWIPFGTPMWPGIRLTGKPLEVDTPAPPVDRNG